MSIKKKKKNTQYNRTLYIFNVIYVVRKRVSKYIPNKFLKNKTSEIYIVQFLFFFKFLKVDIRYQHRHYTNVRQ